MNENLVVLAVASTLLGLGVFGACVTENATAIDGNGPEASGGAGAMVPGGRGPADTGTGGDATTNGGRGAADYSLLVDAPADGASVRGVVRVHGRTTGYRNVEVWDSAHEMPPLAQVTPGTDGAFSTTVDTTTLSPGPTSWTVWAWDSPPGTAFKHSESVPLDLTIEGVPTLDSGSPGATIGTGDMSMPAVGPGPSDATKIGGAAFVLVKNWDFGRRGTIKDVASLVSEFQFHDQFGTIANGTKAGAVTVAATAETAITQSGLGLPNDMQPVEDPARPTREWTDDSLKTYVRPLSAMQTRCTVSAHDAGSGSLAAKWNLSNGGAHLGKDVLWETRVRMPTHAAAYWFSLWASGNQWNKGAEMDVLQSFGTPNIYPPPSAFHVDSVGGQDSIDYASWPAGLDTAKIPASDRDLTQYHVVSWLYGKDDSYKVYFDGVVAQSGSIHWTLGGAAGAQAIDLNFLFDLGWGYTDLPDIDISLPVSSFPITYELDYSRVYLR